MDKHLKSILNKQVERTMDNLVRNNMTALYVETKDEVIGKVSEFINEGDLVAVGGSVTLFETGVIDHLRSGRYSFLDRYMEDLSRTQLEEIYRKSFFADTYLTSTNAITEDGELYNVDGNGNRVAAMIYGPKSVIVVAGVNKIVKNIDEAIERVRRIAAPANSTRLERDTPCVKTGYCVDCKKEDRICCSYTIFGQQRQKDRIKVILVGESLGY
ncbi:MAG: lactate utilization protein [Acetivibrionales bacterium]|jgi:L-lactate utilization protein LutB|nr:lactate utilization protein [Clostridiaceae bacterium]